MDCKNCVNCDFVWGFMCTCRYSYNDLVDGESFHHQIGQDVNRLKANTCKFYTEETYDRDEVFVI